METPKVSSKEGVRLNTPSDPATVHPVQRLIICDGPVVSRLCRLEGMTTASQVHRLRFSVEVASRRRVDA